MLPSTCFQWTGTSVMPRPSRRARARISTSKANRSMRTRWKSSRADRGAERLEPALGVLQPEPGPGGHELVEQAAHQRSDDVGGLDHRVAQCPAADGHVVVGEPVEEQGYGQWVDGHVGVHVGGVRDRAAATPARTAAPLPRLKGRRSTRWWGRAASSLPATAAVPSVLPSSTTTTSVRSRSMAPADTAASNRRIPSSRRWASLNAGTTIVRSSVTARPVHRSSDRMPAGRPARARRREVRVGRHRPARSTRVGRR